MKIHRVKGDLDSVYRILSVETEEKSDCIDVASYLVQQAIEKSLKYLLHDVYGVDDTTRVFKIHNISRLLDQLNEFDHNFVENHVELQILAGTVTEWEARSRYEDLLRSSYTEVRNALGVAEKLYDEVRAIDATRNIDSNAVLAEQSWTGSRQEEGPSEDDIFRSVDSEMPFSQDGEDCGPRF